MFQRFVDEGLAQSSYLIACPRTREAAVVDPRRDVESYLAAARDLRLSITCAIETHIHADFVSGARELAARGARVISGPGANLTFPHHEAAHHEQLQLGDARVTFLHTPGHTPEHISLLVDAPDAPRRVLTGDTLFVAAVGRPDLLGADQARPLAEQLFDSLHGVLLALDDDVEVHPGHGAGSLCGAGIGAASSSTIGAERRSNALLRHQDKPGFVAAVLADLPETPPYFPRMKVLNHAGPRLLEPDETSGPPPALDLRDLARLRERAPIVLDLRDADAFAVAHPAGALHLEYGPRVGYWAGWVVPADAEVVLMADGERQAADARLQLLRVGIDGVAGFVRGGFAAWSAAGLPVAHIDRLNIRDLLAGKETGATIVDVRSRHEFEDGHLDGALHIPLNELQSKSPQIPAGKVATICESGYRSSLAASVLARQGLRQVASVSGGMAEYRMNAVPR